MLPMRLIAFFGVCVLFCCMTRNQVDGARILIACVQMYSHIQFGLPLGEELVRRGHEVHIIIGSRFPKMDIIEKTGVRPLIFEFPDNNELFLTSADMMWLMANWTFGTPEQRKPEYHCRQMSGFVYRDCELMFTDEKFMNEARRLQFDVAIVEPFWVNPCIIMIAELLNVPSISLTDFAFPWTIRLPSLPSFFSIPNVWGTNLKPRTFYDSVHNLVTFIGFQGFLAELRDQDFLQRFTPGVPSYDHLMRKSELFLTDSVHYLDCVMPTFPNVVQVGGFTTGPPSPLTGQLATIFDEAQNGVILVSFGSMAHYVPTPIIRTFFDAFSRLNQTIVAKFRVPEGVEVPSNVHMLSWIPQNDILGHAKTLLFVTHCGSNGQHEAIYNGVPMLGFPMFADQYHNADRIVQRVYGLTMNVHTFTASELVDSIDEMLVNDTYRKSIRRASEMWRDQPLIGRQKAAFWVEHVIKYGGAHLRSTAMDMSIYRFLMLDVLAAIVLVIFAILVIIGCIVGYVVVKCRRNLSAAGPVTLNSNSSKKKL